MRKYFIHNPIFRLLPPAVYGILIYLLILLINNNVSQVNEFFSSGEVYICIGLTYLSFETLRLVIFLFNKFLKERYIFIRVPAQIISSTLLSTVIVVIAIITYFIYVVGFT